MILTELKKKTFKGVYLLSANDNQQIQIVVNMSWKLSSFIEM